VYPAQDPNEPNNTFATATPLTSGEAVTSARLYLSGDVDYYRFTATANSQVTVFMKNPPDHYYRYQIYNAAQNLVYDRGGFLGEITETHHLPRVPTMSGFLLTNGMIGAAGMRRPTP
jgi:hypothetical protein